MAENTESAARAYYSLLRRFNLDEGECNKVASKPHLEELCKVNCTQWRELPSPLDVETVSVDDIERSTVEESSRRLSFLYQWKQIKGSAATYRQLIFGLIGIKCEEDAANVCKLLKRDATVHRYPARRYFRWSSHDDDYKVKSRSSFIAGFSSDIRMDLQQQLQGCVREVINHYASFVSSVCSSLIKNDVSPQILSSFLLSLPAFKSEKLRERGLVLMSGVREQLESAVSIYDVINTMSCDHASFVNCEVYQSIVGEFGTSKDHEKMSGYFEHRQDYIERHKLLEYLELHPTFGRVADPSNKVQIRLDVDLTMRISQLLEWRTPFGDALGVYPTTLRLFDVEEDSGSPIITFLIPAILAREVFGNVQYTEKQVAEFRRLSVVWMKYCDNIYDFTEQTSQ